MNVLNIPTFCVKNDTAYVVVRNSFWDFQTYSEFRFHSPTVYFPSPYTRTHRYTQLSVNVACRTLKMWFFLYISPASGTVDSISENLYHLSLWMCLMLTRQFEPSDYFINVCREHRRDNNENAYQAHIYAMHLTKCDLYAQRHNTYATYAIEYNCFHARIHCTQHIRKYYTAICSFEMLYNMNTFTYNATPNRWYLRDFIGDLHCEMSVPYPNNVNTYCSRLQIIINGRIGQYLCIGVPLNIHLLDNTVIHLPHSACWSERIMCDTLYWNRNECARQKLLVTDKMSVETDPRCQGQYWRLVIWNWNP